MDPISLIVSALVSGITMGLQSVGQQAVTDSYKELKARIIAKYGSVRIEQLERAPQSPVYQAAVEQSLRSTGAIYDQEVLQMAEYLLDMITNDPRQSRPGGSTSNSDDPIENAQRAGGYQAVNRLIDTHINQIMSIRRNYPLNDTELISTTIARNKNIPDRVRNEVGKLHGEMRRVIVGVASLIEDRKYKSAEEAIGQMQLAYVDRQRAIALVQADKRLHISYQALKTTIEFFANLNQVIIAKISMTPSPQMETEMVLGNAILVYELTDFVISYIEGFAVDGVADIVQLHEETKRKITDIRRQQTSLEQLVKSEAIDAAVRDQTLEDIASRAKSLNLLEQEWHVYIDSIQALDAEIGSIRRKISTLEVIRENARIQIELIQAVAMLQFLKKNIGTIEATVLTLERIKLVSLSPNRVRRLLGIN